MDLSAIGRGILDFIQSIFPVEKLMNALTSVLRFLGLAFIFLVVLFLALLLREWGLDSTQRFVLLLALIVLMALALLVGLFLAAQRGDLLLAPYERSLRRGRRYGTNESRLSREEIETLPAGASDAEALPPSADPKRIGDGR